jgi:hypothetical protein
LSKKEVPLEEAINEVIQSGVLNFMVECLKSSSVEIQKEASWVLINVSAGSDEHADAVIDIGAIDHLVNLIDSVDIGLCNRNEKNIFFCFRRYRKCYLGTL